MQIHPSPPACPGKLSPQTAPAQFPAVPRLVVVSGEGRECGYSDPQPNLGDAGLVGNVSHQMTAIFDVIALYEELQRLTFGEG